uniref:hAT-like transposase RNase-H fold domain-containing protein n=1 Tax=Lactuca sativa TaxID=4236 RepID=A0A9R1UKE3_LACSA|nr:hypothetical protein LSAT_V11C900464680 [Lactuca sativa]
MMKMFWLITLKLTTKTENVNQQRRRKNMPKERLVESIMMNLRLTTFNIANANGVTSCSKLSPMKTLENYRQVNVLKTGFLVEPFVENETFIEYTNALNGKVVLPCRTTVSKRVVDYYVEEKSKLNKFFSNPITNVHLTTDCWKSSCQRSSYMVVTTHFVDKDWVMHKRVIKFKSLNSHRGEDIGRMLLTCLEEWGINNVMTITVDNATSNDKAIEFLMKKLSNLYDEGKQLHVRCMDHILSLIIKDGFDEHQSSIKCIQKAVRYIRNSTQWIQRFKECMKELNVESKKFLCNDSPTRWNSTYELLKIAVKLEKVFGKFEVKGPAQHMGELGGGPRHQRGKDINLAHRLLRCPNKFSNPCYQLRCLQDYE